MYTCIQCAGLYVYIHMPRRYIRITARPGRGRRRKLAKGRGTEGLDFALMRVASTRKLLRLPAEPLEDSDDMRFSPFNVISYGLVSDVQRRDNFIRILCARSPPACIIPTHTHTYIYTYIDTLTYTHAHAHTHTLIRYIGYSLSDLLNLV